jgi:pimeloyl-ACP methyl ester carboxylesterase
LTVPAIVEHLEGVVSELDKPPIIMGHSAGGLLTQILLEHGYGAAGVAIDSAPP